MATCLQGNLGLSHDIGIRLHDFSEEGIRLVVSTLLTPGEEVEVGLAPVLQSKAVTVTGTVVWSTPTEGGFWAGIHLAHRITYAQLQILT